MYPSFRPIRSARARTRCIAVVLLVAMINLTVAPTAYAFSFGDIGRLLTPQGKSSQKYEPATVKKTDAFNPFKALEKAVADIGKGIYDIKKGADTFVDKAVQNIVKNIPTSPKIVPQKPTIAPPAPPPPPAPPTVPNVAPKDAGILSAISNTVGAITNTVTQTVTTAVKETAAAVKNFVVPVVHTTTAATRIVYETVTRTVDKVVPVVKTITENVIQKVEETFQYPVRVTKTVLETVIKPFQEAYEIVKTVPRKITEWVTERVAQMKQVARTVYDTVRSWVTETVHETVAVTKRIAQTVWRTVTEWVPQTVRSWFGRFWGWATQWVPRTVQRAETVWRNVTEWITRPVQRVREVVRQVPRIVYDTVTEWVNVTKPVVKTVYDIVRETAYRTVMKPVQIARDIVETVWQTGTRIVEKVVPVVKRVTEYVIEKVSVTEQVAKTVYDYIPAATLSAGFMGPLGPLTADLRTDLATGWDGFADSVGKFKDEMKEKYKEASNAGTAALMERSPDWLKPVIGFTKEWNDTMVGITLGVGDFVASATSGIVRTVIKPEDTVAGIGTALGNLAKDTGQLAGELWNDPGGTIQKKAEGAWNGIVEWSKKDALDRGEDLGKGGAEIASWAIGIGEARAALQGAKLGNFGRALTGVAKNEVDDLAETVVKTGTKTVAKEVGASTLLPPTKTFWKFNEVEGVVVLDESSNLRYAQQAVSSKFQAGGKFAGKTIDDVVAELKNGVLDPKDVPINYIEREGLMIIDNTRSTVALQKAGIEPSKWNWIKRNGNPDWEARITEKLEKNGLPTGSKNIKVTNGNGGETNYVGAE